MTVTLIEPWQSLHRARCRALLARCGALIVALWEPFNFKG